MSLLAPPTTRRSSGGGSDNSKDQHEEGIGVRLESKSPVGNDTEQNGVHKQHGHLWTERDFKETYYVKLM